ncbi:hypothetical protein [Deinococcus sp. YIM 77859]|uniref:hypothetical protein n=1 Tax=Deinococcus sp. YIM 77859 TaxID=1540221 RepID=UPI0012E07142|nr:hypothetical protein [Deinococcus sp. YIM 77859]
METFDVLGSPKLGLSPASATRGGWRRQEKHPLAERMLSWELERLAAFLMKNRA